MFKHPFAKILLPHLIAFLALMMLSFIYFAPALSGKVLSQSDNIQAYGMQHEAQQYIAAGEKTPLWTNSAFGGMPTYQICGRGDWHPVASIYRTALLGQSVTIPHTALLLLMFGCYLALIALKVDWRLAILGAGIYGLATNYMDLLGAGHSTKVVTMAFVAPTIAGWILAFRGKYLLGGAIAGTALACQIIANHVQVTYYSLFLGLFIGIAALIEAAMQGKMAGFVKGVGAVLVASLLAVAIGLPALQTNKEYAAETIRAKSDLQSKADKGDGLDKEYAFGWSYGIGETMTVLIPNFKGGGASSSYDMTNMQSYSLLSPQYGEQTERLVSQTMYFGDQPFAGGTVYFGAVLCVLFLLGLLLDKGVLKWGLLLGMLTLIMLSWGKNLPSVNFFLFDNLPLMNKFRGVSTALGVAHLPFAIIAGLGLSALFTQPASKWKQTAVLIAGGTTILIALLALSMNTGFNNNLSPQQMPQQLIDAFAADRYSVFSADVWRSIGFATATTVLLWAIATAKLNKNIGLALLAVIGLTDIWSVSRRYLNEDSFQDEMDRTTMTQPRAVDTQIQQTEKDLHYRVIDVSQGNPFSSAIASYHHKSIGGYHAAKLSAIQNVIEKHLVDLNKSVPILEMFNVKYIISSPQQGAPPTASRINNLGNAWFVPKYDILPTPDAELDSLGSLNPREKALIRKDFEAYLKGLTLTPDTTAFIRLTSYHPDKMVYQSKAASEQLALFSEIYYPPSKGWKVAIDGKPIPEGFIRANYALRALRVPAGEHTIEMRFEPDSYYQNTKYAFIASCLLTLLLLVALYYTLFKEDSQKVADYFTNLE